MGKMKQQTQNNVTAVNGQWKGWWYGLSVLGAGEFGVGFRHVQPGSHPDSQVVSAHHALHTQVRSWSVQISSTRSGLHLSSEWVQVRVISLVLPASKTWHLIVVRLSLYCISLLATVLATIHQKKQKEARREARIYRETAYNTPSTFRRNLENWWRDDHERNVNEQPPYKANAKSSAGRYDIF